MTPEQKQQYLATLQENEGASLTGIEATTYRKAVESIQQQKQARERLTQAMQLTEQLRNIVQQLEGRHQACLDLLCEAEELRQSPVENIDRKQLSTLSATQAETNA